MTFGGIRKLTLLDYPDKTACTLFTVGCNFRCPYCQNSSLIDATHYAQTTSPAKNAGMQNISPSDVLDFLKTRHGLLDGVCISGGEPLIHDNLAPFIDEIKKLGFLVKIDTNGSHPQKLEKLLKSGKIDYVAIDIKNTAEKYAKTIGLKTFDITPILDSIKLLKQSTVEHEYRTTVVREFHTEDDLISIAKWLNEHSGNNTKFYLQNFVSSDNVLQKGLSGYSATEMEQFQNHVKSVLPQTELRGV